MYYILYILRILEQFGTRKYKWKLDLVQNLCELWQFFLSDFLGQKFFNTPNTKMCQGREGGGGGGGQYYSISSSCIVLKFNCFFSKFLKLSPALSVFICSIHLILSSARNELDQKFVRFWDSQKEVFLGEI